MKKLLNRAAVRHLLSTVVSVVLSVSLAQYLPAPAAAEIGNAAGHVIAGGA